MVNASSLRDFLMSSLSSAISSSRSSWTVTAKSSSLIPLLFLFLTALRSWNEVFREASFRARERERKGRVSCREAIKTEALSPFFRYLPRKAWRGSKSLSYLSERRRSVDRRTARPGKFSVFLTVTVLPREPLFIFHGVAYTARPARTHDCLFKACPGFSMVCKLRL